MEKATERLSGLTYLIVVGSWYSESGNVVLDLAFVPRALNDDFAKRIPLGSGNVRARASTLGATNEPDENILFESW